MAEPMPGDPRDRAVDALLELAAVRPWSEIGLGDIAERAGLSLKELRAGFASKGAILGAFSRRIDLSVLGGDAKELAGEPPRERVFDVLMSRFEALRPHRTALRSIRAGIAAEPLTVAALNAASVNSMQWMLAYAGLSTDGLLGAAKAQGLALLYARAMAVFLDDEDPALARTMKVLDEELRAAEPWIRRAEGVTAMLGGLFGKARRHGQAAETGPADFGEVPSPAGYTEPAVSPIDPGHGRTGNASDLSGPI